jgi:hypothetical protein
MAAPAKAFIDPTFLSRLGERHGIILFQKVEILDSITVGLPTNPTLPGRLPVIVLESEDLDTRLYPKVPTPPMGRLSILTFPPIYRERGNGAVTTGQLFPPKAP